jgi:hypothetical protein
LGHIERVFSKGHNTNHYSLWVTPCNHEEGSLCTHARTQEKDDMIEKDLGIESRRLSQVSPKALPAWAHHQWQVCIGIQSPHSSQLVPSQLLHKTFLSDRKAGSSSWNPNKLRSHHPSARFVRTRASACERSILPLFALASMHVVTATATCGTTN